MTASLKSAFALRADSRPERERLDDQVLVRPIPAVVEGASPWHVLIVADGADDRPGSAHASQRAASQVVVELTRRLAKLAPGQALRLSFHAVNTTLWATTGDHPDAAERGAASLLAVVTRDNRFWVGSAGAVRALLVRDGEARPLTDDTWDAEQARLGSRSGATASATPALGVAQDVEAHVRGPIPLQDGDVLVLGSDGLFVRVPDAEVAHLAAGGDAEAGADRLLALARERGGAQDIGLIVCSFRAETQAVAEEPPQAPEPIPLPKRRGRPNLRVSAPSLSTPSLPPIGDPGRAARILVLGLIGLGLLATVLLVAWIALSATLAMSRPPL